MLNSAEEIERSVLEICKGRKLEDMDISDDGLLFMFEDGFYVNIRIEFNEETGKAIHRIEGGQAETG